MASAPPPHTHTPPLSDIRTVHLTSLVRGGTVKTRRHAARTGAERGLPRSRPLGRGAWSRLCHSGSGRRRNQSLSRGTDICLGRLRASLTDTGADGVGQVKLAHFVAALRLLSVQTAHAPHTRPLAAGSRGRLELVTSPSMAARSRPPAAAAWQGSAQDVFSPRPSRRRGLWPGRTRA